MMKNICFLTACFAIVGVRNSSPTSTSNTCGRSGRPLLAYYRVRELRATLLLLLRYPTRGWSQTTIRLAVASRLQEMQAQHRLHPFLMRITPTRLLQPEWQRGSLVCTCLKREGVLVPIFGRAGLETRRRHSVV